MISNKMEEALNAQVNAELYSAYLYLSMAAYFESINMGGMATWMRGQFAEEQEHGLRFFVFVKGQGARVSLAAIEAPRGTTNTLLWV